MDDARWMNSALALARRALGRTWPNPAVGCIIVRDGKVLGRGHTRPGGRPHAETEALAQASDAAGATAYVTLEPCAHHGRTPPCADALVAAGIRRVVCPLVDPDPRVAGRGFARLRAAGVRVDIGALAAEAARLNAGFLSRIRHGRPHVLLKLATTLDGRIATATGESRWITGPASRARVHMMRAEADAIMIGAGTARADDPSLDVRLPGLADRSPVRVVADPGLSLDPESRLARSAGAVPVWLIARADADQAKAAALEAKGIRILTAGTTPNGALDPAAMLRNLADAGLTRVLCEGGGQLSASLLAAGLVDELALFQAGKVFGGDGIPAVGGFGLAALADAPGLALDSVETVGTDTLSIWRADPPHP